MRSGLLARPQALWRIARCAKKIRTRTESGRTSSRPVGLVRGRRLRGAGALANSICTTAAERSGYREKEPLRALHRALVAALEHDGDAPRDAKIDAVCRAVSGRPPLASALARRGVLEDALR